MNEPKKNLNYLKNDAQSKQVLWGWTPRLCKIGGCPWVREKVLTNKKDAPLICDHPRPGKNCAFEKRLFRRLMKRDVDNGFTEYTAFQLARLQINFLRNDAKGIGGDPEILKLSLEALKVLVSYDDRRRRHQLDREKFEFSKTVSSEECELKINLAEVEKP